MFEEDSHLSCCFAAEVALLHHTLLRHSVFKLALTNLTATCVSRAQTIRYQRGVWLARVSHGDERWMTEEHCIKVIDVFVFEDFVLSWLGVYISISVERWMTL